MAYGQGQGMKTESTSQLSYNELLENSINSYLTGRELTLPELECLKGHLSEKLRNMRTNALNGALEKYESLENEINGMDPGPSGAKEFSIDTLLGLIPLYVMTNEAKEKRPDAAKKYGHVTELILASDFYVFKNGDIEKTYYKNNKLNSKMIDYLILVKEKYGDKIDFGSEMDWEHDGKRDIWTGNKKIKLYKNVIKLTDRSQAN